MVNELRATIERFKIKAEDFLRNNIKAFIVDVNDTYYFCDILLVGDEGVYIQNFKGIKEGIKKKIFWADIVKFEEYKDKTELEDKNQAKHESYGGAYA